MHRCQPLSPVSNSTPTHERTDLQDDDRKRHRHELAIPPIDDVPTLLETKQATRKRAHARSLADNGFERNEQACPECPIGALWSKNHETVCDTCAIVFDEEERRRDPDRNPWRDFWENRDAYQNGTIRCVGGYSHPYDWVTGDDLEDQHVSDVDPTDFYR